MTVLSTTVRTAHMQAIIDAAGASAKIKFYDGTVPTGGGAPAGTLLATLTGSTTIGTASAGVLDFDEAGFTQNNASHVTGTPTFIRITTSADAFVADIPVGGGVTVTGTITTGVDVTFNASTITAGNA